MQNRKSITQKWLSYYTLKKCKKFYIFSVFSAPFWVQFDNFYKHCNVPPAPIPEMSRYHPYSPQNNTQLSSLTKKST